MQIAARFLLLAIAAAFAAQASAAIPATATVQRIAPGAFAYVPSNLTGPGRLIVLLHGAGGNAQSFIREFRREADDRGTVLLAVQSSGRTWAIRRPEDSESDVVNIKAAIAGLSGATTVDLKRATVMGFSDGASYAISMGLAYPELFHAIVAFSPGYAFAPRELDTHQRIFIAHSRRDPILPAENTRQMVKSLENAGFAPEVHWFNGGHEIDPQLKKLAFDFALAP